MTRSVMFKSPAARETIERWHGRFRDQIGSPVESRTVPTSFGATHVLVGGPENAPPLVILHGALASSAHLLVELRDLLKHFRVYAVDVIGQSVKSADVIMDRETGRSKGFGFVEMGSEEEAKAAIAALNGQKVNGRPLTVNEAKPREERPGGGRGGFRQLDRRAADFCQELEAVGLQSGQRLVGRHGGHGFVHEALEFRLVGLQFGNSRSIVLGRAGDQHVTDGAA